MTYAKTQQRMTPPAPPRAGFSAARLVGRAVGIWCLVAFAVVLAYGEAVSAQSSLPSPRPRTSQATQPNSPPATERTGQLTPPSTSRQAPVPKVDLLTALERRGDLTLRNSSLNGALFTISELWGVNIVSSEVNGSVNGVFKDAPLREILDSILLSNGYGYRPVGESLVVSNLSQLGQVNPFFVSASIPVRAADVNEVVAGASLLMTPQGQIKAIPSARSIFVLDFPDRVKMIREFIVNMDNATLGESSGGDEIGVGPRPLEVAYLKTHFVPITHARAVLQSVLSPVGKLEVMELEDRMVVVDYAENLRVAQDVLMRIDRPRPQVSIKALIYDISLNDMEQLGINWNHQSGSLGGATIGAGGAITGTTSLSDGFGAVGSSVTKIPFADGSAGGAFTLYNSAENFSLAAVVQALQEAGDSRLLADPNVTVAENELAVIQSVSEIPFQQLTQTAAGGNIGTTAFKVAGITLEVRPKIAYDGTIEMFVKPEFSRLTGFTPGDSQPIIDRRTANTTVRIANNRTFVLGGMRQRSDVGDFKGIPFLKDVRVIGHLFRSRSTDIRESELVVFITPTIVGYDEMPSPRHAKVAETVNCRLQRIPGAQGCSDGCGCEPMPQEILHEQVTPGEMVFEADNANLQQPVLSNERGGITPLPPTLAPLNAVPTDTEQRSAKSASRDELQYPTISQARRLPPTLEMSSSRSPKIQVATRPAPPRQATPARQTAPARSGLRKSYDERFNDRPLLR